MRFYNLLLHLYPESFRNEYGEELRAVFARQHARTGAAGALPFWIATIGEVVFNATAVHVDILRQDLSYTARVLRHAPGFALTAIAIVALGIGATTAAFSVTDFVLIRPLPFPEPDRLVKLLERTPGYPTMELSAPNYRDWQTAARSFASMGVYHAHAVTMTSSGEPRRVDGTSVSSDLLPTLGVAPMIGRGFAAADDRAGAAGTIILSYRMWQIDFGGDRAIVGRTLTLDNEPYTVIGVMPPTFRFPRSQTEYWVTNRFTERDYQANERTNNWLYGIGRLRPGVSLKQAQAEMDVIAAQLERQFPAENKETGAAVYLLRDDIAPRSRLILLALSGASGCVLLIACANLASLLLARALSRKRELAVRSAMGAGHDRLVRQLLTESLLLAILGGTLGVGIAVAAVPLLTQLVPTSLPLATSPTVDVRVLGFSVALIAVTGIAFGFAPVLRVGRTAGADGLREGARAGGGQKEGMRAALVVAEIAASVVLLVSAGLLIRALMTVQAIDPGFNPEGVLTMRADLPVAQYRPIATREAFYARALEQIRALPGVRAAGFVSFLPMGSMRGGIWPVRVKGDVEGDINVRKANNVAGFRLVTTGYFAAMGIPIKLGRDVSESDASDRRPIAVVSESFVKRYWPGQDPIGRRFDIGTLEDREVVGVVGDVRFRGLERISEPQAYLPSMQVDNPFYAPRSLAVRASLDVGSAVRDIIRRADPAVPVTQTQMAGALIDAETSTRSAQVRILSAFALIAFTLAAVGIHGLLSFAVAQRTPEIGVRMALGAQRSDVLGMVTRRVVTLLAAGIVPGLALAYAAGRSFEALLAGVKPFDAPTFGAAVGLTMIMTIAGALVPAIRAMRVDPIRSLRAD